MKRTWSICLAWLALAAPGLVLSGRPADLEKPRKEWKELSPAERQARVREYKSRKGEPMFSRAEIEARRKELKSLPPEERRARIREWREKNGGFRIRLEGQLLELRQKQSEGALSEEEAKRLERLEVLAKRFDQTKHRSNRPAGRPPHPPEANPPSE